MTNTRRQQGGFTIVETLVAITILMIAVVGPLTIVSKALTAALDANNQMVASNLAQETMELIKNQKDQNVAASATWLSGISSVATPCTSSDPTQTTTCDMQVTTGSPDAYTYETCGASTKGCQLYKNPSIPTVYTHDSSGSNIPTPFTRYYYLNPVTGDPTMSEQVLVRVVVTWNSGSGLTNRVQLQDFMTSASE
jgi:type II secretory pathway pseudopilin PulG